VQIIDDMGDNPYFVQYENNMYAHYEVVYHTTTGTRNTSKAAATSQWISSSGP